MWTNIFAYVGTTLLLGFFHQVIPDSSTTLVLSLHHPQSHVREIAIKHLGDLLRGKEVF